MDISATIFNVVLLICIHLNEARYNFNGRNLKMAAEVWDPWFLISEENGQVNYSGIMPKILKYLEVSLNFTTTLSRPPDGAWGAVDNDGNWGGMVGMVKRNEVDFALGENPIQYHSHDLEYLYNIVFPLIGPFSHTYIRSQVVDFSIPVYIDYGTGFLAMEIPKDYSILIRAFGWRMWTGFLFLTPMFIVVFSLSDWFYDGQTYWWSYIQLCLRSICMDSVRIPSSHGYVRIYFLAWILGTFILSTAYQGISVYVNLLC